MSNFYGDEKNKKNSILKIIKKYKRFSDFFYNATMEEKKAVFTQVAFQSNVDQREVVKLANFE